MRLIVFLMVLLTSCSTIESAHEQNLVFQKEQSSRTNRNNFKKSRQVRRPNKIKQKRVKIKNVIKL